jgi:hypothetical protein
LLVQLANFGSTLSMNFTFYFGSQDAPPARRDPASLPPRRRGVAGAGAEEEASFGFCQEEAEEATAEEASGGPAWIGAGAGN